MAYSRMGPDSDVYMYFSANGINCCGCRLMDDGMSLVIEDVNDRLDYLGAIKHLIEHLQAGDKVHKRVFDRLLKEYYDTARIN